MCYLYLVTLCYLSLVTVQLDPFRDSAEPSFVGKGTCVKKMIDYVLFRVNIYTFNYQTDHLGSYR